MRIPFALLALLAGVSAVSAASIELSFGTDTTGTIDEVDVEGVIIPRVTLQGSDFAYIDIVLMEAADGMAFWYLGTSTEGESTDLFTFEEVIPGPRMLESPDQPAPGDLLDDWRGANYVYPYIVDGGDFLLVTLVIHCTGAAGETLVMLDDLTGEAFVTRGDLSDYTLDFAAPMVLVRQLASDGGGGSGGGVPADDGDDPDAGDDPTDDPADDGEPVDSGTVDTDDDGLSDADDPDDDDDGVPDEQDADPHDPDVGASAAGDGGSTGGTTSGGGSRAARGPCGAGMITALPLAILGGCGLVVRRRSSRRG